MSDAVEKVGTWDAMADAIDSLHKGGLVFVLTVGMENSNTARTRTNAADSKALKWLNDRHEENIQWIDKNFGE